MSPLGRGARKSGVSPRPGLTRTHAWTRHWQDRCVPTALSLVTAASGWPQWLALAFGMIGQVLSRKSNVASVGAGSREGERRKWCVPAGTKVVCPRWCETPEGQVCPHGLVLPQDRCVPTGCVKGDCRQWVAPAVGLGVWRNRISVVAEKQQRSRRGRGVSGAAATVVCPRWCGVSPLGWCFPAGGVSWLAAEAPDARRLCCVSGRQQSGHSGRGCGGVSPLGAVYVGGPLGAR